MLLCPFDHFFFTPSPTDTPNAHADRGRARSRYYIKKVTGVPNFLFRSWRARSTTNHSIYVLFSLVPTLKSILMGEKSSENASN